MMPARIEIMGQCAKKNSITVNNGGLYEVPAARCREYQISWKLHYFQFSLIGFAPIDRLQLKLER